MLKISLLIAILFSTTTMAREVKISCFHYPPYTVDPKYGSTSGEGIIVDSLRALFKPHGITLKIEWTTLLRAIKLAESGEKEGICAINPHRSTSLEYVSPKFSSMSVDVWALKNSNFKYRGVSSLKNVKVGNVAGYVYNDSSPSYQEYLERNEDKIFTVSGSTPVERVFKLMEKGRIDIFAVSEEYVYYLLGSEYIQKNFKKVGRLENDLEAFFAINPRMRNKSKILGIYKDNFAKFTTSPEFLKIYRSYIK